MKSLKKKKFTKPTLSTVHSAVCAEVSFDLHKFLNPAYPQEYGSLESLAQAKKFLIVDPKLEAAFDKVMTGAHQIHQSEQNAIPTVCVSFAMSMLVKDGHVTHEEAVAIAQAFEFFDVKPGSI